MIRGRLVCGCAFESDGDVAPYCHLHHEGQVQSVTVRPPTIVAKDCAATGPLVRKEA